MQIFSILEKRGLYCLHLYSLCNVIKAGLLDALKTKQHKIKERMLKPTTVTAEGLCILSKIVII